MGDLLHALEELLALHGVHRTDALKVLRREGGDWVEAKLPAGGTQGVSNGENARVEHADDVSGVGLLNDLPLGGHQLLGAGQADLLAALDVVDLPVCLKLSGDDAHKGDSVPMGLVHVGLDLKDKGGKVFVKGIDHIIPGFPGQGSGRHAEKLLQEGLHTEVGRGGAEKHRRQLAVAHPVQVEVTGGPVQQFDLIHQLVPLGLPDQVGQGGVVGLDLGGGGCLGVGVGGEMDHLPILPVVDALELLATADGPVHGVGVQTQLLLQFLAQLKGVPGLPVHLVDEGEDGDVPHGAYLEQLSGLGLHALGRVDDHDGGVGGHQGAVGVLREVLVARGVQDVDAVALILELHYRGGNGNAALLLNLHPVGGGRPGVLLALHLAGLGDGPAVEQELLRQCGLARIGMGDDGKGPSALDFRFILRHELHS